MFLNLCHKQFRCKFLIENTLKIPIFILLYIFALKGAEKNAIFKVIN